MSHLLPVPTIILTLCLLILTEMELTPLLRESTGSSLSSSELFSSQFVPGFEFKLRAFMGRFFSFPFLPFLWSALNFERQTLCKCPTFLHLLHLDLIAPPSSGACPSVPPHLQQLKVFACDPRDACTWSIWIGFSLVP